jgi:hypothetical protein
MGISVILKDQAGTVLASLEDPYIPLVSWADRSDFPILGHVDPYGNTIYNRGQIETLLSELKRIRDTLSDLQGNEELLIRGLEEICADGLRKPHRFLWFLGD